MLQVSGAVLSANNFRSQAPTSLHLPSLRATTSRMHALFFIQTFDGVPRFPTPVAKNTPQDTVHPTSNLRIKELEESLSAATNHRSQSALKGLARFD